MSNTTQPSQPYTVAEANQLTQMLKDLAVYRQNHPGGPTYNIDYAVREITEARDWTVDMLKKQGDIPA